MGPVSPARQPDHAVRNCVSNSRTNSSSEKNAGHEQDGGGADVLQKRLPENTEQTFFWNSDRDRPPRDRRAAEAAQDLDAFARFAVQGALRCRH